MVVIDGAYGFGNGLLMPAGPLRELVAEGLDRADVVVILGDDKAGVRQKIPTHLPVLSAQLVAGRGGSAFAGRRAVAFAGIGRPEKFFDTLHNLGCELVGRHAFADHHRYRDHELLLLADKADKLNASLVTTAKDMVRVSKAFQGLVEVLSVDQNRIPISVRRQQGRMKGLILLPIHHRWSFSAPACTSSDSQSCPNS